MLNLNGNKVYVSPLTSLLEHSLLATFYRVAYFTLQILCNKAKKASIYPKSIIFLSYDILVKHRFQIINDNLSSRTGSPSNWIVLFSSLSGIVVNHLTGRAEEWLIIVICIIFIIWLFSLIGIILEYEQAKALKTKSIDLLDLKPE